MSRHPAATATLLISLVVIVLLATYGLSAVAQSTVNGVITGSHFALGAMGLTIIYGILRLTNFAYGDYLTFGACVAVVRNQVLHAPIALPAVGAMAVVAIYSVLGELVLWRPLRKRRARCRLTHRHAGPGDRETPASRRDRRIHVLLRNVNPSALCRTLPP
jgi:neutral amino acid transport system permease protein